MESVGFGAPTIGDVFERDKVCACVDGADALTRVPTRQVGLHYTTGSAARQNIGIITDTKQQWTDWRDEMRNNNKGRSIGLLCSSPCSFRSRERRRRRASGRYSQAGVDRNGA